MKSLRSEEKYFGNKFREPSPDQLHLVDTNEFLPRISQWTTIGGGLMVGIFFTGISLAAVLDYNVTVKVPATIRPAGELRVVQSAISGTVQQIEAEENQLVAKGEPIARVHDSRLQIQKSQLQGNIRQGQLQLRQLDAQSSALNVQMLAEASLINRTVLAAQADLGGIQRNYADQQIKAEADLTEADANLMLAKIQRDRFEQEKVLTASVQEAEAGLKLATVQRDRLKRIVDSGAISRNQLEEKEQAVRVAESRLEQAKVASKNLLEDKKHAVQIAQLSRKRAITALDPSNSSVTVASERIKQEQARGEATLAALNKERQTLLQQRLELQNQLNAARKELQQVETNLKESIIRSPIEGTLLQLNLRNQGQVVQPSEAVAYIAPLNAPLLIKTRVQAQDIDKVKPGQKVQMQVSACPYPDYGTLKGTVKTVAPDAVPSASNTASAPPAGYEVTIQPQTLFVGDEAHQCRLQSGMEGRADIISREETVLKFVLRKARLVTDF